MRIHPLRIVLFLLAALVLSAVSAAAQTPADVDNPSAVTFTASADHAKLDRYDVEILRPDGTVLQTINAAKPTPDGSGVCTVTLNVQPVAFGRGYSVRVRSVAGTATSGDTEGVSANKFNRTPGGPTKVTLK